MSAATQALAPRFSNATRRLLVATLLALFAVQVLFTASQMSPAYDEVAILPAGYAFLQTGQWQLLPEHPPLIPTLSALPLLLLKPHLDLQDPGWAGQPTNVWTLGSNFLFGNDADRLLFWGRLPVLLLSLLLAYVVYQWADELYGGNAGLMALALYAFCPTIIAHSGYTSHDVGLSCFSTLALYRLWRFIIEGTWPNLLWSGLLLGLALATKTSAIILPPIVVGLILLAVWERAGHQAVRAAMASAPSLPFPSAAATVQRQVAFSLSAAALILLMAFGVLYTIYLFPNDPLFYVKAVLRAPRLHVPNYPYYLMGQFRAEGWWYYFLVAFALKTPIPMLLLLPLALWHWRRQEGAGWFREAFLLLPALAYVILISTMADPLGIRYLLPLYPLLFIFVSRTAPLFTRKAAGVVAGVVLAAWYLSTPIRIYPDYLAYFNEFVGGPIHGIAYLDDSNIDWGQNLKRLRRYLDARQFDRVKLLYFGTGRPDYYGIRAEPIQLADLARPPEPGIYIISANALVRARAYFKIDWLTRYELLDVVGYSFYLFTVR